MSKWIMAFFTTFLLVERERLNTPSEDGHMIITIIVNNYTVIATLNYNINN